MTEGFSGDFVPPGHMTADFKPQENNLAEMRQESARIGVGLAADGSTVPSSTAAEQPTSPPFGNVRTILSAPVPAARTQRTRSTDPATCLKERIAEVELDIVHIQIEIAKLAGLQVERRRLTKALEAFQKG